VVAARDIGAAISLLARIASAHKEACKLAIISATD
jgi:hypothetical protein